jgi:hypothetical protein
MHAALNDLCIVVLDVIDTMTMMMMMMITITIIIIIIKPMFLRQERCNITDYCNGYLDCLVRTANW